MAQLVIMSELLYVVETLPRVQTTQIFVLPLGNSVTVTPHSIKTCKALSHSNPLAPTPTNTHSRNINLSHLDFSGCSSPKLAGGVLNLRFPVKASARQVRLPSDPLDFSDASVADDGLTFSCAFCGQQLTKGSLGRVLPLPSDLWQEFGGSVFCHYHEHKNDGGRRSEEGASGSTVSSSSSPRGSVLVPKDRDCLANSDRFLVTAQSLDWDRIEQDQESNSVGCRRCRLCLGVPMPLKELATSASRPYSLLRSSIRLSGGGGGLSRPVPSSLAEVEAYLAHKLHTFSQDEMQAKFVVADSSKTYISVWMLNVLCRVETSLPRISRGHSKFSGEQLGRHQSSEALKVLFQFSESGSPTLKLCSDHCMQLCLLLANSNMTFPPAHRLALGYKVGYLHY